VSTAITTFLMFEGRAEEAMEFYASLFEGAEITSIERYDEGDAKGTVKRATLRLPGQTLICVDSPVEHAFGFTPAISLFVDCESDDEVDRLFAALTEGGTVLMGLAAYPFSQRFGWVDDRFGVSWQLNLAEPREKLEQLEAR
jgi:predicted 3-demethylubiquinone-9 3-methyltransferase (glyoxalase superfamily)